MLPRLLFLTLILAALGGAGYGVMRLVIGRQPLPNAVALLESGDPKGAQLILRGLVKSDNRNAEAHLMLGRTQLALSDPIAAEKEFKIARVLKFDRDAVNPLLGQAYLAQERYQDVLSDFPVTGVGTTELVQNLVLRSAAYGGLGETGQARASIEQAARLSPDDARVVLGQARVAIAADDPDAAMALLDHATGLAPNALDVSMLRADILVRQGRGSAGKALMDKAVSIAPFSVAARLQRANYLITIGDVKGAKADVDACFDVDWHDSQLLLTNAVLMIYSGRVGDGEVELQRLAASFDRMPRGYYYQAVAGSMLEHNEVALEAVNRYLRLEPRNVEGLRLAATLELRLGRPARASAVAERATALGVNDAQLLDTQGRSYFTLGDTAGAIVSFRQASALDPANKEIAAHLTAAEALARPAGAAAGEVR